MKSILRPQFLILIGLFVGGPLKADETKSLSLIVAAAGSANAPAQKQLLKGMLAGLAGRRNVPQPEGWAELATELQESADREAADLTQQLSRIFGDQKAIAQALVTALDQSAEPARRQAALRQLMQQQSEEASDSLEELLQQPVMRLAAIRGYSAVENPMAPTLLLEQYPKFNDTEKKAVVETLASRRRYAEFLLNALREKQIRKEEIPSHVARSLNDILGQNFVDVYGQIRQLAADRQKRMAHYRELLTPAAISKASPERGRKVFQKTCANCHTLYGAGGKIGPDLTGSNRANLDYILLNSVDPSYDVPEGYRMLQVVTVQGQIMNGILAEEDGSRIVLKTVEDPKRIIPKTDIEVRKVSDKSMMPDGQFDALKPQQVIDLIRYLRTTSQVKVAP